MLQLRQEKEDMRIWVVPSLHNQDCGFGSTSVMSDNSPQNTHTHMQSPCTPKQIHIDLVRKWSKKKNNNNSNLLTKQRLTDIEKDIMVARGKDRGKG